MVRRIPGEVAKADEAAGDGWANIGQGGGWDGRGGAGADGRLFGKGDWAAAVPVHRLHVQRQAAIEGGRRGEQLVEGGLCLWWRSDIALFVGCQSASTALGSRQASWQQIALWPIAKHTRIHADVCGYHGLAGALRSTLRSGSWPRLPASEARRMRRRNSSMGR